MLHIDNEIRAAFKEKPIVAYRRNKNLRDILRQTTITNNKVQRKMKPKERICQPCMTRANNLFCKQVLKRNKVKPLKYTTTQTANHLLSSTYWNVPYANFNMLEKQKLLSTYDSTTIVATKPSNNAISVAKHFHDNSHSFNRDAKFTIMEAIRNNEKRQLRMKRENFWIKKLNTLSPNGLNMDLNNI